MTNEAPRFDLAVVVVNMESGDGVKRCVRSVVEWL